MSENKQNKQNEENILQSFVESNEKYINPICWSDIDELLTSPPNYEYWKNRMEKLKKSKIIFA